MSNTIYYRLSNGHKLGFYTAPELFSPSSIDAGTLAMLRNTRIRGDEKVLDLGCGYGFVGIYLAIEYGIEQITMCDINPRAVEMSNINLQHNQVDNRVVLSDALESVSEEKYSLVLSNPPYHTDFSVAKRFIEQSFKALELGGRLVMVVKRLLWYRNKITSIFGGVQIKEDDGYYILIAEKRSPRIPRKKEKTIKSKHKRKLARSQNKNRRIT